MSNKSSKITVGGRLLFLVAFVLYGISIFGGFIQDDVNLIANDPEMGSVSALGAAFVRPYYYMNEGHSGAYRPLTSFSFYLNALITGKEAWGFRLVNVLLYGGVCLLVFRVLKKYSLTKIAFWGALIFTVLPIHTEAVNNIVGRAEILSLGFVLFALLSQFKKKWELSALMFLLALLSKEVAMVGLPILVYALLIGEEKKDTKIGVISFYLLVTICYLFLRFMVLGNEAMGNNASIVENPLKFMTSSERIMNAFSLVPFGLGKVFFPINLSYDYSFNQLKSVTGWFDWRVLLGLLSVLVSLILVWRGLLRRNTPPTKGGLTRNDGLIIGMMMFWGSLAITGNFLFSVGTIFGERLWFWPSLGVIMMITSLFPFHSNSLLASDNLLLPASDNYLDSRLKFLLQRRRTKQFKSAKCGTKNKNCKGLILVIIIISLYSLRTEVRNVDWLSQERLFIHDAEYSSESVLALNNKAAMLLLKNEIEEGGRVINEAEKIYPKYPELMNNRGMYHLLKGETEKAGEKFEECLVVEPGFFLCEDNLKLLNQGK